MGGCSSSNAKAVNTHAPSSPRKPPAENSSANVEDAELTVSMDKTQRQLLPRIYEDKELTEVYDIIQTIGRGSLGEVCIVQKKNTIRRVRSEPSILQTNLSIMAKNHSIGSPKITTKPKRQYACKTVNTLRMQPNEIREFINEVDILRDLNHPNIIQLFEVFQHRRKIWIVTELCRGGDLTSRISKMNEEDVVLVVEQVFRAVSYMHSRSICHRDIKLENIMYLTTDWNSPVKLIDFGLSNRFTRGVKMLHACGTAYTVAPEILLGEPITEKSDIWSMGVVTFLLLSESYPFLKDLDEWEDEKKREDLKNARFQFGPEWEQRNISNAAKEFVSNCLKVYPGARWSASAALKFLENHWIPCLEEQRAMRKKSADFMDPNGLAVTLSYDANESSRSNLTVVSTSAAATSTTLATASDGSISSTDAIPVQKHLEIITPTSQNPGKHTKASSLHLSVASARKRVKMKSELVDSMSNFALYGALKKTILVTMVSTMDKSNLQELSEIFSVIDTKNEGTITLLELKDALKSIQMEKPIDDATIEKLFKGIDVDQSGLIHYNEFLAAVVESQGLVTMENLAEAFERIDTDGKGFIAKEDLKKLLGTNYNKKLVDKMIREADPKKDGQVDYDAFLRLMFEDPTRGYDSIVGLPSNLQQASKGTHKSQKKYNFFRVRSHEIT